MTFSEPQLLSAIECQQGWQQALQAQNITPRPDWIISCNYSYRSGYGAVRRLLNQTGRGPKRPTALFIANDTMVLGALCALQELRLRVPDDLTWPLVAVGGPPHAAYSASPLTVVSIPMREVGRGATRILLEQLDGRADFRAEYVMLTGALQIRASYGAKP